MHTPTNRNNELCRKPDVLMQERMAILDCFLRPPPAPTRAQAFGTAARKVGGRMLTVSSSVLILVALLLLSPLLVPLSLLFPKVREAVGGALYMGVGNLLS